MPPDLDDMIGDAQRRVRSHLGPAFDDDPPITGRGLFGFALCCCSVLGGGLLVFTMLVLRDLLPPWVWMVSVGLGAGAIINGFRGLRS